MQRPVDYPTNPEHLWNKFYEITQVPRPSKKEDKIRQYLVHLAENENLDYKVDNVGNVVIYLPATSGFEARPAVIIQNHMDMVCDKTPELEFDFDNDPIDLFVKDGWISANGTTLGADNGFGCAAALALIHDKSVSHPSLELLFTVDEETGLNGALNLDGTMFKGKRMINLDTEDWETIYIGCAGGVDWEFFGKSKMVTPPVDYVSARLEIIGLKGGHSGLDIHRGRANAIKIANEILWDIRKCDYRLAGFIGGKAHNIIPRDACVDIMINPSDVSYVTELCLSKLAEFEKHCLDEDREIEIRFYETDENVSEVFSKRESDRLLNLVNLFPHGAFNYDWKLEEPLVSNSSNLAVVKFEKGGIYIETSLRFVDEAQIRGLEQKLEGLAYNFNLKYKRGGGYPGWKPDHDNALLELVKGQYREMFGKNASVKAVHAGLECGILLDKLGKMDVISIGPNITGAHSPTERLEIDSALKFWDFFTGILSRL